jgi:hypothetical protein
MHGVIARRIAAGLALLVLVAGCDSQHSTRPQTSAEVSSHQDGKEHATLLVTRNFGRELIAFERTSLTSHSTAISLLRRNHTVQTDEIGNVLAIDDMHSVGPVTSAGATRWNFFVGGLKIQATPTEYPVLSDDVVQLDLQDADASYVVRGTVGHFPQPFTGALAGRYPRVSLSCASRRKHACQAVHDALDEMSVDVSGRPRRQPRETAQHRLAQVLQTAIHRVDVEVGPWSDIRDRPSLRRVVATPYEMGVFFSAKGDGSLHAINWDGRRAYVFGRGTGILAMFRSSMHRITWLVTGTDWAGVERAALHLPHASPQGAFSVVFTPDGVSRLPSVPPYSQQVGH